MRWDIMKNKSMMAIYVGISGFIFLLIGQYISDIPEPLTTVHIIMVYIFLALGLFMIIFSIVLGAKGYKRQKSPRVLRFIGVLFTPFLIILTITFFFLIGWAAFIR